MPKTLLPDDPAPSEAIVYLDLDERKDPDNYLVNPEHFYLRLDSPPASEWSPAELKVSLITMLMVLNPDRADEPYTVGFIPSFGIDPETPNPFKEPA